ncbi:MAG: glucose-6-phosphate isomerase [Candidatus Margulisbacteria bacterium]|nr:glucose-6-phosphate isomerase [Candidatus Margulisiibacteriota bacterium]
MTIRKVLPLMNQSRVFEQLLLQAGIMKKTHLKQLWDANPQARADMIIKTDKFSLDYGFQRVTSLIMDALYQLAREMELEQHIAARFNGEKINVTEGRAVGHHALRAPLNEPFMVDGVDQMPLVYGVLEQLERFSNAIISGQWRGVTGKKITKIVGVGIGGSKYGPEDVYLSLSDRAKYGVTAAFVSNVDPEHLTRVFADCDPETTLFVIESKTFTTAETVEANAQSARRLMLEKLAGKASPEEIIKKHFVAVSTAEKLVKDFGIDPANMFGFWDWVGGRFSVWSAIGGAVLGPTLGFDTFKEFLAGGRAADLHYRDSDFEHNVAVTMALIRIWNRVLMDYKSLAVVPYSQPLRDTVFYLTQQIEESLGKGVDKLKRPVNFVPTSIVMGDSGSDAQHSFFQAEHQIPEAGIVPIELTGFRFPRKGADLPIVGRDLTQHQRLLANLFAQRRALAFGETNEKEPHRNFSGNRPTSLLMFDRLSPFTVGLYLATYENVVDAEGAIEGINAYDQYGVEKGKKEATAIEKAIEQANRVGIGNVDLSGFDLSTQRQIREIFPKV